MFGETGPQPRPYLGCTYSLESNHVGVPFDFQEFSSEITTGVVVFVVTQLPK